MLLCSVLVDGIKEQQVQFEVLNFMERVILPDIAANGQCPPPSLPTIIM